MAGVQPRCDSGKQSRPAFGFALDKREALGTVTSAPEDWCDSGLDCLSGAALSLDDSFSNETSQTWGSRSPLTSSYTSLYDTDKRPMDCSSLGSGERLDSAIGDSITDETMGSISHGLGTMHLNEPVVSDKGDGNTGRQEAPSPEEERRRTEEMFNTLNFVSEDGDT